VEEDFVLREIDVYFNPKPFEDNTQLYIMQYP
jgi:DNA-directed RNA polymerase III subunit RPC5